MSPAKELIVVSFGEGSGFRVGVMKKGTYTFYSEIWNFWKEHIVILKEPKTQFRSSGQGVYTFQWN